MDEFFDSPSRLLGVEPFPARPFALFDSADDIVVHKEMGDNIACEKLCALFFESLMDADAVADTFKQVTGKEGEVKRFDTRSLDEHFWVKLYRTNNQIMLMSLPTYLSNIATSDDE